MTRRPRPAAASRIIATGLATATTLALTGTMALSDEANAPAHNDPVLASATAEAPPAPSRRIVVIVRQPTPSAPAATDHGTAGGSAPATASARPAPQPAPPAPQRTVRTRAS